MRCEGPIGLIEGMENENGEVAQHAREMTPVRHHAPPPRRVRRQALFAPEMVRPALKQAFVMLRPDIQWANPVMFVVEIGAVLDAPVRRSKPRSENP